MARSFPDGPPAGPAGFDGIHTAPPQALRCPGIPEPTLQTRFPFPADPHGWYVLDGADALPAGGVQRVLLAGRERILWRTRGGEAVLSDAHCPHLGAHLGYGGRVDGEALVCPFHGFRFSADGACLSTPYGQPPPPSACLGRHPLRERNGLLLAWWHPHGLAPSWEVPTHDQAGWTPLQTISWRLRSHPQETNENAVDLGHLSAVHGYEDLVETLPFTPDGPWLTIGYEMRRPTRLAGLSMGRMHTRFRIQLYGLGYAHVEADAPDLGARLRHFVWATPRDDDHITLRIGFQWRLDGAGLPAMLARPAAHLLRHIVFRQYQRDVQQDWDIWERKVYLHPPALAGGDGPIGRYRQWCQQFYGPTAPAPSEPVSPDPRPAG